VSAKGAPHDGQDTVRTIIGTKVLVFDKQSRHLSLAVPTSKKDVHKECRYRASSELENSVLEINHVTNMTTVLDETAASDRVSRSKHC